MCDTGVMLVRRTRTPLLGRRYPCSPAIQAAGQRFAGVKWQSRSKREVTALFRVPRPLVIDAAPLAHAQGRVGRYSSQIRFAALLTAGLAVALNCSTNPGKSCT